jgi:aminoglycoside 6'-N-acetyltransferase I
MDIKYVRDETEISRLTDLFIRAFSEQPYNETWTNELALKRLTETYRSGKGFCLYAQTDKVVGLIFCRTQTWHDGVHLIVEDAAVDTSYREKGVGKLLVKSLEDIARKNKIMAIDLLSNTKAIGFWKKLGYATDGYVQLTKKL